MKIHIHWFRRDLRLHDNHGLAQAMNSGYPVLGLFIFDSEILSELDEDDARVQFIHEQLQRLKSEIRNEGGDLEVLHNEPEAAWKEIIDKYDLASVSTNEDYEPYAITRDSRIADLLAKHGVTLDCYKDHVIFSKDEVLKDNGQPYTVYTPFKNRYLSLLQPEHYKAFSYATPNWFKTETKMPSLRSIGFSGSHIKVREVQWDMIRSYDQYRDIPSKDATTYLGPHLRFGTVSVRQLFRDFIDVNPVFISELIWREFFIQILYHFPQVEYSSFKPKYDRIEWRNNESDFERWCEGRTGYELVDAGMRQLNETGFMHNRVRMLVASFLCKHLLIDWRKGEAYFAKKLLDYELASNNGNWQWAAGTGCDAAPYFRVFNPITQVQKFDPHGIYINKWVNKTNYPSPMVEHKFARERALETYKRALEGQ